METIINYDCEEDKYWSEVYKGTFPEYIEPENLFGDEEDCEHFIILKACEIMEGGL